MTFKAYVRLETINAGNDEEQIHQILGQFLLKGVS